MQNQGSSFGRDLGASISRWLGSGDYEVSKNSLVSSFKSSGSIPMMHGTGQAIVVRHKEFICDVTAGTGTPTTFNVMQEFALNPGLNSSFPWLSTVAQNFQEYTWKGLVYHYVPTSGDSVASTNTSLGTVMMATNYRATAASFTNKQFMLNEFFSNDAKPSIPFAHPIECDPKENPYNIQYVRTADVPTGEDQKTYDLGVMSIATQGIPAAGTNVGELWATYEVELRKPIAVGSLAADSPAFAVGMTSCAATSAPFGTLQAGNTTNGLVTTFAPTSLTFRKGIVGTYVLIISHDTGSAATAVGILSLGLTNVTALYSGGNNASTITSPSGQVHNVFFLRFTDPTLVPVITCTSAYIAGSVTSDGKMYFAQVNPSVWMI